MAKRLKFHVVYNVLTNKVTIVQLDRRTTAWYDKNLTGIARIMDGLRGEGPVMTNATLEEVAQRLLRFAAETSGMPVELRIGTGKVQYYQPGLSAKVEALLNAQKDN